MVDRKSHFIVVMFVAGVVVVVAGVVVVVADVECFVETVFKNAALAMKRVAKQLIHVCDVMAMQ